MDLRAAGRPRESGGDLGREEPDDALGLLGALDQAGRVVVELLDALEEEVKK